MSKKIVQAGFFGILMFLSNVATAVVEVTPDDYIQMRMKLFIQSGLDLDGIRAHTPTLIIYNPAGEMIVREGEFLESLSILQAGEKKWNESRPVKNVWSLAALLNQLDIKPTNKGKNWTVVSITASRGEKSEAQRKALTKWKKTHDQSTSTRLIEIYINFD